MVLDYSLFPGTCSARIIHGFPMSLYLTGAELDYLQTEVKKSLEMLIYHSKRTGVRFLVATLSTQQEKHFGVTLRDLGFKQVSHFPGNHTNTVTVYHFVV